MAAETPISTDHFSGGANLTGTRSDELASIINEMKGAIGKAHVGIPRHVSTTGNVLETDGLLLVDASSGAVVLTLPAIATLVGSMVVIKKIDASVNTVTVDGNGSETIDDAPTALLTVQYEAITLAADGTEWWIL